MRTWLKIAVLPAALSLAALASLLASGAGAVPPADPSGGYAGKANFKFNPLTGADAPDKGSAGATASVAFNDPMFHVDLTVDGEQGPEIYTLDGNYGLGLFWASGPGPGGQTLVTGKFTGKPGKLKLIGTGTIYAPNAISTIKLVLKQQPPL